MQLDSGIAVASATFFCLTNWQLTSTNNSEFMVHLFSNGQCLFN